MAIKTDRLVRNMVRMEDGTYAAIVEVDPVHLALGTQAQQEYVFAASVELYNRLSFPIVEFTVTEPTDVSRYVAGLRGQARAQAARGEDRMALFGEQLASYVENARTEHDSYDARSYVVLTYRPPIAKKNAKKNAGPLRATRRSPRNRTRRRSRRKPTPPTPCSPTASASSATPSTRWGRRDTRCRTWSSWGSCARRRSGWTRTSSRPCASGSPSPSTRAPTPP